MWCDVCGVCDEFVGKNSNFERERESENQRIMREQLKSSETICYKTPTPPEYVLSGYERIASISVSCVQQPTRLA